MRETEGNREKKREKERNRCPGSIIINLHSICKRLKLELNVLAKILKISQSGCCRGSYYTIIEHRHYKSSCWS